MNRFLPALTVVLAASLASFCLPGFASHAASPPTPQSALAPALQPFAFTYHARYLGLTGQGTLTLQAAGHNQWRYTLRIQHAVASLTQSTLFDEQNTNSGKVLRPLESRSVSKIPFRNRKVQAHYDWDTAQATWRGDVKPARQGPVALQPGDLDGLLINLAVVRDVKRNIAQNQRLHYRMVDGGRAVTLAYQIVGTETVTLNGKPIPATRVERNDRNKQQIAWIVAGIPAPVRLLQREDGKDVLELLLVTGANTQ